MTYIPTTPARPYRNCDLYADCNAAWKAYNAIADRYRLPGFDFWLFDAATAEDAARIGPSAPLAPKGPAMAPIPRCGASEPPDGGNHAPEPSRAP